MGLFIGNEPAPGHQSPPGWLWLKPVEDALEIYKYEGGEWVLQATVSYAAHTHPTHGDINFTGVVQADGSAGITGSKTLGGFRITFKKGLLTGFDSV